ncbi:MAG: DUF87 domain-containing protein [Xanthomonadaceae bacterium]|nr:DUF87 domain-containing protein [Xanthomonadaceae bacterium]
MITDELLLALLVFGLGGMAITQFYTSLGVVDAFLFIVFSAASASIGLVLLWEQRSKSGRDGKKRQEFIKELPRFLLCANIDSICLGRDDDLRAKIYLKDSLRLRHVHILGATGSGKTESVILNFLMQDVARGYGGIILDAKGDASFLAELKRCIPEDRLQVFDLGSEESLTYDPLVAGTPLESAQRLFSSLTWSEEYYKSKAFSALQLMFQIYHGHKKKNPRLIDLATYLEDPDSYTGVTASEKYPKKLAERDFMELSGLRDQIKTLCMGHLAKTLSPEEGSQIDLQAAESGKVLYFRLQSLMSPQLVTTLGRLLINHLSFLAGTAHRTEQVSKEKKFIPIYLDEFASFACPEFADLISKARSDGLCASFFFFLLFQPTTQHFTYFIDPINSVFITCVGQNLLLVSNTKNDSNFFELQIGSP